jgi:hypothetical protein
MALRAQHLPELAVMLAACATVPHGGGPPTRYEPQEVARLEVVMVHGPDPILTFPQPLPATRYYLIARSGATCEVDYAHYATVQPGDWAVCAWRHEPLPQ